MSKPLKQRLAEKQAYLERRKRRKSGKVETYSVTLPLIGHPYMNTDGDRIYIKERAKKLIDTIRQKSEWLLYSEIHNYIHELEERPRRIINWGEEEIANPNRIIIPVPEAVPTVVATRTEPLAALTPVPLRREELNTLLRNLEEGVVFQPQQAGPETHQEIVPTPPPVDLRIETIRRPTRRPTRR